MAKQNRAQRRQSTFGGGRPTDQGGWPSTAPNPVFGGAPAVDPAGPDEATAGRPDQDQVRTTGPGTGGATEQAGRAPRHEGAHAGNSTKG